MIALFPFIVMFLVTSIATLRERRSGTLERLFSMPLGKGDFILGYALAFGLLAIFQTAIAVSFAVWVCGLEIEGSIWLLFAVAVADALLGTALGLLASAFARTEFQVVQFMPLLVFPQVLLGGIFIPRDQLPEVLEAISEWLPLSYAIDALNGGGRRLRGRRVDRGEAARDRRVDHRLDRARVDHAAPAHARRAGGSRGIRSRAEHAVEVGVREAPLGVELVAHAHEVVEPGVHARAASRPSACASCPSAAVRRSSRMICSTAAKYSVGSSRK